jgi:hypothetical protein
MDSLLIRRLSAVADKVIESKTSNSTYFHISGVIIRLSDHYCKVSDGDLSIFHQDTSYVLIPMSVSYQEVQFFTSVEELIGFINGFIKYHKFYQTKPPCKKLVQIATSDPSLITETGNATKDIATYITLVMGLLGLEKKHAQERRMALHAYVTPRWGKETQQDMLDKIKNALNVNPHISTELRIRQLCK